MLIEVLLATGTIALLALVGAFLFGHSRHLVGLERYVIPAAVGVFMSLVFIELVPETLAEAPEFGGMAIALSFIAVYMLAHMLHVRLHSHQRTHNEKQEAAMLVLFGDTLHNFTDGVLIAGAFLVSPEVGWAVTAAVALHEVPQEIVEFGILIRAGYSRGEAVVRNFISATTVIVGGLFTLWFAAQFTEFLWMVTAFVAGNMLYIAASELLPQLHGARDKYESFTGVMVAILLGFAVMTTAVIWSHENVLPEDMHDHGNEYTHIDEDDHAHEDDHEHSLEDELEHMDAHMLPIAQ